MRLYICGGITGVKDYKRCFDDAEGALVKAGYDVYNPTCIGIREGWEWADYLKAGIKVMLDCDGVAVMNNWFESRGAKAEVSLANELGYPIKGIRFWVDNAGRLEGVL